MVNDKRIGLHEQLAEMHIANTRRILENMQEQVDEANDRVQQGNYDKAYQELALVQELGGYLNDAVRTALKHIEQAGEGDTCES